MGRANPSQMIPHPPQFESTVRISRRARFLASAAMNVSITRAMLLNHLIMNTAATANYRLLSGFKLKSITIWTIAAVGSPSSCSVEWTSSYGPSKIISDSGMGVEPAFVQTSPPTQSLASFWSLTGSNESDVLALVVAPINSVLDITYEMIFQNGETPVLVTTSNGGTLGQVYMTPFDGVVTGVAKPVSYESLL